MNEILAVSLQSIQDSLAKMEKISLNLSNVQTNGYKKERFVATAFSEVYQEIAKTNQTVTDFTAAALKSTGQKLDFGLESTGFFEVATDKGLAYTRQGNFRVDAQGKLVNEQGFAVMGKDGEITLNNKDVMVDAQGNIFDNTNPDGTSTPTTLGKLKIVDFEHKKTINRLGNGLFSTSEAPKILPDADIKMKQGYLESSNVNSMTEMLEMMQTLRHIESMQKIVQGYDEMLAGSVRKLSEF